MRLDASQTDMEGYVYTVARTDFIDLLQLLKYSSLGYVLTYKSNNEYCFREYDRK